MSEQSVEGECKIAKMIRVSTSMPRPIRWIRKDRLYLITQRTFQARYFFIPGKELNALVVGCIAYAAEKFGVRFCFTTFPSNHYHHLVRTQGEDDDDCAERMRAFLQLANSQIAREVQKLCAKAGRPWTGGIFGNERAAITEITDEFEAQVEKLEYLMSQGVKDGLCPDPCAWPGVESASPWCDGSMKLRGTWINRSALWEVRRCNQRRKPKVTRRWLHKKELASCRHDVTLELAPLPCMDNWTPERRKQFAQALREEILQENAGKIGRITSGWRKRLMDKSMFAYQPDSAKQGVVPQVHCATKDAWRCWIEEWESFINRYQRASRRLRDSILEALEEFPPGCFVPSGICLRRAGPKAALG